MVKHIDGQRRQFKLSQNALQLPIGQVRCDLIGEKTRNSPTPQNQVYHRIIGVIIRFPGLGALL